MEKIVDKFDGWKVFNGELMKERRMCMAPPYNTKKKMSQMLNLDPNLIKAYEDEKQFPSVTTLKKICLYLQILPNELLGLDEI
jgi:transcriptional regulator with XRE-family HTH domain